MLVIDQSEYIEDRPVPGPFPDFPMTKREKPWERGWISLNSMFSFVLSIFLLRNVRNVVHEFSVSMYLFHFTTT